MMIPLHRFGLLLPLVLTIFLKLTNAQVTFTFEKTSCHYAGENLVLVANYTGGLTVTQVDWYFEHKTSANLLISDLVTCIRFGAPVGGYPNDRMNFTCDTSTNIYKANIFNLDGTENGDWGVFFTLNDGSTTTLSKSTFTLCTGCNVPSVDNADIDTSGTVQENVVATVTCNNGFVIVGSSSTTTSTHTCQSDGTWVPVFPSILCERTDSPSTSYGGAIGGGVGGGVGGIVVIAIVIIYIRRRQAVDIDITGPKGEKVKSTITPHKDGVYLVEFTPKLEGHYTINIICGGKAIPGSPFEVNIGAAVNSKALYTTGIGVQPRGVRVNTKANFKVHTQGAGVGIRCEVIGPAGEKGGQNIKCEFKQSEKEAGVYECHYVPLEAGRYVINIIVGETKSTFQVDVRPEKSSKLGAYGLKGGVINQMICFIVEFDHKDQTKSKKTEEQAGNDGGSSCFPRNNSILPICTGTDQQPQPSQGGQGQGGQHTAKGQTKLPPDFARQKPDGDNGKHLYHGKARPLPIPDKDDGLQKSKTEKSGSVVSKGDVEIDEALQVKPRKLPDIPPGGEKNIRGISANFDEVVLNKKRLTPVGKESIEIFEEESQGKKKKKKKKKKDKGKDTNVEEDTDL